MGKNKAVDYQTFCPQGTPKEDRRRLNVGDIFSNAAKCLICNTTLRSKNRHDFVTCPCGNLSVDGGSWYCKRNAVDFKMVEECSVCYEDVDNHA